MGLSWPSNQHDEPIKELPKPPTNFNTQQFQRHIHQQQTRLPKALNRDNAKEYEQGVLFEKVNRHLVYYSLKKSGIFTAGQSLNHNNNEQQQSKTQLAAANDETMALLTSLMAEHAAPQNDSPLQYYKFFKNKCTFIFAFPRTLANSCN